MQSKLRLFPLSAVALMLAACGGGSPSFVGPVYTVTNSHVTGAKIICKVDPKSDSDASPNFAAITDANGQARFGQPCNSETVASGGFTREKQPLIGQLRAPVNGVVLTSLTTLMAGDNPLTEAQVKKALVLPESTNLLTTDPDNGSELLLHGKASAVQQLLLMTTKALANLGGQASINKTIGKDADPKEVAKLSTAYDEVKAALAQTVMDSPNTPLISVTGTSATFDNAVVDKFVQKAAAAVSRVDSNIEGGVNKAGTVNVAAAMSQALTLQANLIAAASGNAVDLATATSNMQSNTGIPDTMATAVLGTATTPPTLTTLTTNVTGGVALTVNSAAATTTTTTTTLPGLTTTTTSSTSSSTGPTTSTSTTSTTTSTTLPVVPGNFLYLAGDSIGYNVGTTGAATATYTLANFGSGAGIAVQWPMTSTAALEFKLAGSTSVVPTGPVTVALSMTDTAASGKAQIKAYVDNVNVVSNGSGVTFSVPATAHAWVYAVAPDGSEVKSNYGSSVAGVSSAFSYGSTSRITLGSIINTATKSLGALKDVSGKYRVTLVVNGLPLTLANGSALTNYTVDVPAANGAVKSVSGAGIEGFMTVVNPNPIITTTTTSTTSTTATTASTTTTTLSPNNYVYLAGDAIGYNVGTTGAATATYTLANFGSGAGIAVQWPMASTAALEFNLGAGSTFVAPTGPVTVALSMTDTAASGKAQIKAYVDNVNMVSNSNGVTFSVPATAHAWVYAVAPDGSEIKSNFGSSVAGVSSAFSYGSTSRLTLGSIINAATQRLGALKDVSGKYRVTLVVNGLPLKLANGSALTNYTVDVPAANGSVKSVSGAGIEGFMTVVNPNPPTTTSTTSTTTSTSATTSTTTTTTLAPTNYLYLTGDSIGYNDGTTAATTTTYTLADFHLAAGIQAKWPMASAAALEFKLASGGTFMSPTGPVTVALAITDTAVNGKAQIKAYIDNVNVASSSSGITVSVPDTAHAWMYAMAPDGSEVKSNFGSSVAGVSNAFTYGSTSRITLGSIINAATQRLGALKDVSGRYRVTLVMNGLPLKLADGSAMTNYTVDVPAANGTIKSVSGAGIEGFMTVVNPNPVVVTTTTSTTVTTSSTTTTTVSPTNYVYLANDSIGFDNGAGATVYTLAQFQASPGIAVKWPMASTAAVSLTLTDAGAFNLGSGLTTSAALEIADTAPTGLAWLKAYIDGVKLTQSGANVVVSVPATALARMYARGPDGTEILSGFADAVAGVNNTLTPGVSSSIVLGNVVSNAMARLGSGSTLVNKTFKVTLVLPNAPVRLASGATLATGTVTVPGLIVGTAAAVTITGPSLTGYINLIP